MIQSLFLAHGSPMTAIEDNEYTNFLSNLGQSIKPKAIVIFTAHWESETLTISSADTVYDTIYDFYGFPRELYEIKYQAKGSSLIALKIQEKLTGNGIKVKKDTARGLDHGSWTLLKHLYPNADIPVVQISVNASLPIKEQVEIGKALQGLGQEDILIIGSGVTVHNLREVKWDQTTPDSWAVEFDEWLIDTIKSRDMASLYNYKKLAPNANLAVPTAEHFVPLFIALGSGNKVDPKVIYRSYELGNLSYLCLQF
ncbi:MAG: dioxygenase [Clostridiaceae bacterium]|nr:dioxygenase [Clostridiaceae bacterium]